MSKIDEQIQLEMHSVTRGIQRFYDQLRNDAEHGNEYDGPVGSKVVNEAMTVFIPVVVEMQREARRKLRGAYTTGRRLAGWEHRIRMLNAPEIAYVTIRSVVNSFSKDMTYTRLARRIGTQLETETRVRQLRALEAARKKKAETPPAYNRIQVMKREVKKINPKVARKWIKVLNDLTTEEWEGNDKVKLGAELLERLVFHVTDIFEVRAFSRFSNGKVLTIKSVQFTEATHARLNQKYQTFEEQRPWLEPMVCPPKPWTTVYNGGYLRKPRRKILKEKNWRMIGDSEPSAQVFAAINRIQEVPWAVNARVCAVAQEAVDAGDRYEEVLPVAPRRALPPRVASDAFAMMVALKKAKDNGPAGKAAAAVLANLKVTRKEIWDHNNRLESKRQLMSRQHEAAKKFALEPAIYFPHQVDFRGRAYPMSQDLHPQADDFGKGLLMFSERRQLGDGGLRWLCFHLANTYGCDKMSRPDQLKWVDEYFDAIIRVAVDPLGEGYRFWYEADEPWQFLAAAIEFDEAMELKDPSKYWSCLPIHVDGSCNGLQHLSAMGLDPVGAHAVNLTGDPERQDIYGIVADKVADMMANDAYSEPAAKAWDGNVTRKTVKRGVMTVPYGLTDVGMRDQLIEDRHTAGLPGDPRANAVYLRDRMKDALDETIEKGREIMVWLQDCAAILTENGVPAVWYTPSGFKACQGYYKMEPSTYTILGVGRKVAVQLQFASRDRGLQRSKQVLAVAPNVIHSFDAAHMMLAVNASRPDIHVAVVHDSFGCHAADMDDFLATIKVTFVDIYRKDWFKELAQDFQACLAGIEGAKLTPPPERGDFDIHEVLESEYFFS